MTNEPIPAFILLTHRPNNFPGSSHQSNPQDYGYLPSTLVVPTVSQGSAYAGGWINIKNEIKQATDDIKEEFNRNLQSLTEQMAHLIQNPRPTPVQQHESRAYNLGVWYSLPGCTNRAGHPAQLCPTLLQQQYQASRNQYQQQQQAPAQPAKPTPKPYQPPHCANQARPMAPTAPRPQQLDCPTCGKKHALGDCWIENNVQCGNCSGTHPTDRCRRLDRVDPMVPFVGNFRQQAQDNMRGAKSSGQAPTAGPPNMYFDHLNHRQMQRAPEALQTARGTITLAPPSSSVVLIDLELEVQQTHYIDSRPPRNIQSSVQAVLKSGHTTGEDSGALGTIEETVEDDEVSLGSSNVEMDFTRLNEETQHAVQDVRFDRESSVAVDPDEDQYQHINQESLIIQRQRTTKASNPAGPYDLWEDLELARANISFGKLIYLAPSLRKQMREGATVRREARFMDETKCAEDFELNSMEEDWDVIKIDVQIMDKIIPHTMIDEGSSINVMPLSTMNKLGLSITEPSFSVIHIANHRTCKPSGRIRNLNVNSGGENYKLTFEVLPIKGGPEDFPLLLGRGFLRKSGGVANWSAKNPTFTYGPPTNRTTVLIKPRAFFYDKVIKPIMPTSESLPGNTEFAEKNPLFTKADLQETIQCIGPGLYDFKDNGTLSQWLVDNPYLDDEATVEVTNCITIIESPPVQDLSSSQMEAEHG
jgi:hypothetical protein